MSNSHAHPAAQALPALAPRTIRGLAVLVDSVILIPPTVLAVAATFGGLLGLFGGGAVLHPDGVASFFKRLSLRLIGAGSTVVAILAWTFLVFCSLYQMYLLATRGQTIGKRFFGIRIVDMKGQPAMFITVP